MEQYHILARIDALEAAVAASDKSEAERNETLSFIEGSLKSLMDYACFVARQTMELPLWKREYEGIERLTRMEDSMRERNRIHDGAISSLYALNRQCVLHGVEPLVSLPAGAPKDETVRTAVASFIGALAAEAYSSGTGSAFIGKYH